MESIAHGQAKDCLVSPDESGKNPYSIKTGSFSRMPLKPLRGKAFRASLGTTAKFAAICPETGGAKCLQSQVGQGFEAECQEHVEKRLVFDPETGEIIGDQPAFDPMAKRVERFVLQSVVKHLMGSSRTAKCLRWRQSCRPVEVWKSAEYRTASYAGLQTCASVWACPVCAAKIAERRRSEIIGAMAAHKAAGGGVFLLTLTAPHQRSDGIVDLLAKHAKALRSFWSLRSVKAVLSDMGNVGQIRAAEVTHGRRSEFNNGWHPHHHVLLFVAGLPFSGGMLSEWSFQLYGQWARCCEAVGLGRPSFLHGVQLDDGSKAAAYVSKWGLEDEMTKGHTKKSSKGETPFDFLRAVLADSSDKQAGRLFVEFAEAFKGKQQLRWSPGLKKRFAVGEVSDEELAAKQDDLARMLGTITVSQWRDVLRVEGRGLVLYLAASGGWSAVQEYLSGIHAGSGVVCSRG